MESDAAGVVEAIELEVSALGIEEGSGVGPTGLDGLVGAAA